MTKHYYNPSDLYYLNRLAAEPDPQPEEIAFLFDYHDTEGLLKMIPISATITNYGSIVDIVLKILSDYYPVDRELLEDQLREHFKEKYTKINEIVFL